MSELTGAVGVVQLKKLPSIIRKMRASKLRIKKLLDQTPGLLFRTANDEAGDTGSFLIMVMEKEVQAHNAVIRMQDAGLNTAVRLADYGMHIYSNIPQLVDKVPLSPSGNPWNLPENHDLVRDYSKGACPQSDGLFARSIILPIPSCLTREQEQAAAKIIQSSFA